jgi:pimeloyl-ACP methyl ester carboxylesterase
MKPARTLALALPGAAAAALWGGYRHAVREFQADRPPPPRLPGHVRSMVTHWGRLCYRVIEGSDRDAPLVLIHGWGRSADSAWWPLLEHTERTVIAVDLPGHGRSNLEKSFSFDLATEALQLAIEDAGLDRPILVGHSMGGPVSLMAVRRHPTGFGGLVVLATSAYWVSPRLQVIVAAAPYLFAPRSPIVRAAMRQESRRSPEARLAVSRSYGLRPSRRVLAEAGVELRRFDARRWEPFEMPPLLWLVTRKDGVISPADQTASAAHLEAKVETIHADHAVIATHARELSDLIDVFATSLSDVADGRSLIRSAAPHSVRVERP